VWKKKDARNKAIQARRASLHQLTFKDTRGPSISMAEFEDDHFDEDPEMQRLIDDVQV
jgi:hypothetical protein